MENHLSGCISGSHNHGLFNKSSGLGLAHLPNVRTSWPLIHGGWSDHHLLTGSPSSPGTAWMGEEIVTFFYHPLCNLLIGIPGCRQNRDVGKEIPLKKHHLGYPFVKFRGWNQWVACFLPLKPLIDWRQPETKITKILPLKKSLHFWALNLMVRLLGGYYARFGIKIICKWWLGRFSHYNAGFCMYIYVYLDLLDM